MRYFAAQICIAIPNYALRIAALQSFGTKRKERDLVKGSLNHCCPGQKATSKGRRRAC